MYSQLAPLSRKRTNHGWNAGTTQQGAPMASCASSATAMEPSVLSAGQNGGSGADCSTRPARPVSASKTPHPFRCPLLSLMHRQHKNLSRAKWLLPGFTINPPPCGYPTGISQSSQVTMTSTIGYQSASPRERCDGIFRSSTTTAKAPLGLRRDCPGAAFRRMDPAWRGPAP